MPLFLPIGDILSPETLGVMIPIMIFMIPIIAILTAHQRKMAEIVHRPNSGVDARLTYELESMRRELAELKSLMHQQAIAIDNLAPRLPSSTDIGQRLENVVR